MQVIIKPTRRIQNTQLTRINILYTLYLQKIQQQQNMTKNKHITISLIPTLLICILMMWVGRTAEITGKVVEIEPVALDVIISIYDRAIILFNHGIVNSTTFLFEHSIKQFISAHPSLNFTRTIFGVCDLSKDQSGKLNKFGAKPSLQIITKVVNYQISFPSETSQISQFFSQKFSEFLQKHSSSKAPTISKNKLSQVPGFSILISPSSNENIQKSQRIYTQIFDYMNFFNTKLFINSQQSESNRIDIYLDGNIYSSYAQSAIDALFNFTISQQPHKQQINDFVDYVNIQTIANVTLLNQQNYYRVFGSSIEYQILFVYQEAERNTQKIQKILQQFQEASIRNRNEGLKYERVLFASGSTQFLDNYFSDTLLQPGQQYSILITKTDYSSFQLRKFIYQDSEVTSERLIQFIHDVRMKKLNPKYKSEKIEDNSGKLIRKIVGDNFYDEIFQQSQKSVLVLFIDSKESQNGGKLGEALREFVEKNHGAYQEHMNVGIFDLAKNQHKSLTISTAPELILFERSNKKKPKFFKGEQTKETIKNWLNYEAKDFTIPQNYGEPPIALGGSQQL